MRGRDRTSRLVRAYPLSTPPPQTREGARPNLRLRRSNVRPWRGRPFAASPPSTMLSVNYAANARWIRPRCHHEQANHQPAAPQNAARPVCDMDRDGRRADHRRFRRQSADGADRAVGALRGRRRNREPQGPRRLRLDLRARSRARRQDRAAETHVRGGGLRAVGLWQHGDRNQRRPQAQLRMGTEEPVRAAPQRPLSAFQRQRARARPARLDQQSRADAQPLSQRGLRVRQRLRVSGAAGRS